MEFRASISSYLFPICYMSARPKKCGQIKYLGTLLSLVCLLLLSACEGGGNEGGLSQSPASVDDTTEVIEQVRIGNIDTSGFNNGILGLTDSSLFSGDSSLITVDLVDRSDQLLEQNVTLTFTSICLELGTASIDPLDVIANSGHASVTYTLAEGCTGDTITASAEIDDNNLSALGFITVPEDPVKSIRFVSALPEQISIAGSGGTETSIISFQVVDGDGIAVADRLVTFSLDNNPGGATLNANSATSDESGLVSVTVRSGTVLATLVVTANVSTTDASTTSSGIAVTTGLPDQLHFGIAASNNNVDGYYYAGNTSELTAYLSDIFGNPVPEGTKVTFTTEGGSVIPSCLTAVGRCTVTWTSTGPYADLLGVDFAQSDILAVAIGNESFTDENGNGLFDDGEDFEDLGEPYRDDNNNGAYDVGEYFFDHNDNGLRDEADGIYNGILCNSDESSCDNSAVAISARNRINMADGSRTPIISGLPNSISGNTSFTIAVSDFNGNPLPGGTVIEASSAVGVIASEASVTTSLSGGITFFSVAIEFEASEEDISGFLSIKVSMPRTVESVTVPILVPGVPAPEEEEG